MILTKGSPTWCLPGYGNRERYPRRLHSCSRRWRSQRHRGVKERPNKPLIPARQPHGRIVHGDPQRGAGTIEQSAYRTFAPLHLLGHIFHRALFEVPQTNRLLLIRGQPGNGDSQGFRRFSSSDELTNRSVARGELGQQVACLTAKVILAAFDALILAASFFLPWPRVPTRARS